MLRSDIYNFKTSKDLGVPYFEYNNQGIDLELTVISNVLLVRATLQGVYLGTLKAM